MVIPLFFYFFLRGAAWENWGVSFARIYTSFAGFNLVKGTLIKGFESYAVLPNPFSRAAYIMFLISEIHPFLNGNGRIARIIMNAEMVIANQSKIIIPNVYGEDYILSLRK